MSNSSDSPVTEFYDRLSADYDVMTGFVRRFPQEEGTFRKLVNQYRIATAMDAGCGTGFHSCLLARLGVEVTGVDVSTEMLARAAKHANELRLNVKFVESAFGDIEERVHATVDSVFCLGNSLVHLLSREEILKSLRSFWAVLHPGGSAFIQILNFDRVLSRRSRVQSVKEEGDKIFIRFYDFEENGLRFNILTLRRTPAGVQHQLDSVLLRPMGSAELSECLAVAGFRHITMFGNARLEEFDRDTSADLFVVGTK